MLPRPEKQPVTVRALAISIASLALPVVSAFWFPDWTSSGFGMLIWLTALIPAFLLSYYRGLAGVALALAGGMAVITATQVSIAIFGIADPHWNLLLGIVAVYLAVSVGIAGLAEVLRRERKAAEDMALSDRLTGLPNRRHADTVLSREFAAAKRGHELTVVVFDLDRFKSVNDNHGHAAGDATIRAFAKVLLSNTRKENLSARYGGEEFVSILRDATPDGARVFAQRVLDQFRGWPFDWGAQTVSGGIAMFTGELESPEELIRAADRALYQAKEAGRDKLAVAPHIGGAPAPRATPAPLRRRSSDVPPSQPGASLFLVDNDERTRGDLARGLGANGHQVWDTGDAREAVRRFAAATPSEHPDVVIVSLELPELSGPNVVEVISTISPGVRVIYLAEHGSAAPSPDGPGTVVATLRKPVDVERLLEALDTAAGR
jgi:diguanylate cyclase (GGDEF)-like protein